MTDNKELDVSSDEHSTIPKAVRSAVEANVLVYRFGLFELDTAASELWRDGRRVPLQEKPLAVLRALLERPGEVVEREALRRRLWPDAFHVEVEPGINAAVGRLREALGDTAANPRFVATVPRRGYRFIAPVMGDAVGPDPAKPADRRGPGSAQRARPRTLGRSWRKARVASVLVALAIPLALLAALRVLVDRKQEAALTPSASVPHVRLAVLPFRGLGGDPKRADLGDGLTAELISLLGRLSPDRLRVIALTSVAAFRDPPFDMDAIGRELDVGFVLEGTVQAEGDAVRITAALVEVSGQTRLWSATYDRVFTSLMTLERQIATEVVGALALALEVEVPAVREAAGLANAFLLRGRAQLDQRTEDGFRQALHSFEAALAEDPAAVPAYAGMAAAWAFLGIWDHAPKEQAYPQAKRWAQRALQLDPRSAEGHLVEAAVRYFFEWRYEAAAESFDRTLALNPSAAQAHLLAASFWSSQGDPVKASAALERALTLDPLSPATQAGACWLLFVLDREDEALARCRRALAFAPDFLAAWDNLKWIHIRRGDETEAVAAFLRVVELEATHAAELDGLRVIAARDGIAGLLRASLGEPAARLAESGQSPYNFALDHAALGAVRDALDWLELAFTQGETDLVGLAVDPRLDVLRGEPRFEELLRRMGLRGSAGRG